MTETTQRSLVYVLSGVIGVLAGAFSMMLFMFNLITNQATLTQRLEDHIVEWRIYHDENEKREAQCARERKEIERMVYELRSVVEGLTGKRFK